MDAIDIYRQILKDNIAYDALCFDHKYRVEEITEFLELMLETVCSKKKTIRVNSEDMPAEIVKSRIMKLNQFHLEYILDQFDKTTTDVQNIRAYMLTALYNAPGTIGNHYTQMVKHDMQNMFGNQ